MIPIMRVAPLVPATSIAAANIDMSEHGLRDYLAAGIREIEWRYGFEPWQNQDLWRKMGSVCPVCFALDGQRFKIEWLLANMRHAAPKYTMSHVNCECRLFPVKKPEELLDFTTPEPSQTVEEMPDEAAPGWVWDEAKGEFAPPEAEAGPAFSWNQENSEFVPAQESQSPWVWDEKSGEFITREEWDRRGQS